MGSFCCELAEKEQPERIFFYFNKMSAIGAKLASGGKMFVAAAKPKLATLARYAKVELVPPSPGELGQATVSAAKLIKSATTFKWLNCTVSEATINTLIVVEIACWFFIGECIGRRNL